MNIIIAFEVIKMKEEKLISNVILYSSFIGVSNKM